MTGKVKQLWQDMQDNATPDSDETNQTKGPKFTKGPWHCYCENIENQYYRVAHATEHKNVYSHFIANTEESTANAHLIAAAPDLYEALWLMLENYNQVCEDNNVLGFPALALAAEQALAKAKGE